MKQLKSAKILNDTGCYVYFEDYIVRPNDAMVIKRTDDGSRQYSVSLIYGDEQPDGSLRNLQLGDHLVTFNDESVLVPGTKWCLTMDGLLDERVTKSSPAGSGSPSSKSGGLANKWKGRLMSLIKQ